MLKLSTHPDAQGDIEGLWATAPKAAARILALIEQLKADPRLLDVLTIHNFGADRTEAIAVSKVVSQWSGTGRRDGRDLWRLKLWDLERQQLPYRVIYAYEIRRLRYHVLGVINRKDYNYEPEHPFTKRVLRAYDDVCG